MTFAAAADVGQIRLGFRPREGTSIMSVNPTLLAWYRHHSSYFSAPHIGSDALWHRLTGRWPYYSRLGQNEPEK